MEQEKKDKLMAAAGRVAEGAFNKARVLTGWKKWVAIVAGVLAAGAAAWLAAGCAAAVKQDADGISARWVIVLPEGGK